MHDEESHGVAHWLGEMKTESKVMVKDRGGD